jgi:membrane-bound metal-dependent hydrolase YbcI (DUF457 family)
VDVATHLLVPYAAALWALGAWRRGAPPGRLGLAAAFGVGGFAPDLDGGIDWVATRWPELYFLQHRGLSHTLVGAPPFGVLLVGGLALLALRFPRPLSAFAWQPWLLPAAALGSWTHLVLDAVTYGGVPALWPFAWGRAMWPVFPWLVAWLFPVCTLVLALHLFRRLGPRSVAVAGAGVALLLVVLGTAQAVARPEVPEGGMVLPRSSMAEWVVVRPDGDQAWNVTLLRRGEPVASERYASSVPPGAEAAVAAARGTPEYRGFLMGLFGPETVVAEREPGGGWNVTFTAVAQRFEATHDARWTPTQPHGEWGLQSFLVREGSIEETHRGW